MIYPEASLRTHGSPIDASKACKQRWNVHHNEFKLYQVSAKILRLLKLQSRCCVVIAHLRISLKSPERPREDSASRVPLSVRPSRPCCSRAELLPSGSPMERLRGYVNHLPRQSSRRAIQATGRSSPPPPKKKKKDVTRPVSR